MNKISENINVFADDDIVRFIRLEKEIPHLMSNLKDQFETQRLEKISAYQSGQNSAGNLSFANLQKKGDLTPNTINSSMRNLIPSKNFENFQIGENKINIRGRI